MSLFGSSFSAGSEFSLAERLFLLLAELDQFAGEIVHVDPLAGVVVDLVA